MRFTPVLVLVAILFVPAEAKDKDKAKHNPKHRNEQKSWPNSGKHKDSDANDEWKRQTEGHRPQDLNGDGVISRHEWPGNDESFAKLDRDGNGMLDDKDRVLAPQTTRSRVREQPKKR